MGQITKSTLKKQIEVEDDIPIEVIDVKIQIALGPKDTLEDIRGELVGNLIRRFNAVFKAESQLMPKRLKEADEWRQMGMFENSM